MKAGVLVSLALAVGCAKPPSLRATEKERLAELVVGVDGPGLIQGVKDLVAAHEADSPIDCAGVGEEESRFCHLTHDQARSVLRQKLEALGYSVKEQVLEDGKWTSTNLVVEIHGTVRPEEVVLVGAHFDAFYAAADDNSSGTAGLLELARLFRAQSFERTVRLVFFDLEEIGLIGSTRYVEAGAGKEKLAAVLVLESIGYFDERPGSQAAPPGFVAPSTGDFIAAIGNDRSGDLVAQISALTDALKLVKVAGVVAPSDGAFPLVGSLLRSDHAPFWLANQPALFLTDTGNFRNPHYHQPTDRVETLNPELFKGVVQLAAAATFLWAGGR